MFQVSLIDVIGLVLCVVFVSGRLGLFVLGLASCEGFQNERVMRGIFISFPEIKVCK